MEKDLLTTLNKMALDMVQSVREIIKRAKFNKAYAATILSSDGNGNYRVKINRQEYTATSYFNLPIGKRVYAIAPNNDFSKLFLVPHQK